MLLLDRVSVLVSSHHLTINLVHSIQWFYCHCMAYPISSWLSLSALETRQVLSLYLNICNLILHASFPFFLKILPIFPKIDFSIRFRWSRFKKNPYIQKIHLQIQLKEWDLEFHFLIETLFSFTSLKNF